MGLSQDSGTRLLFLKMNNKAAWTVGQSGRAFTCTSPPSRCDRMNSTCAFVPFTRVRVALTHVTARLRPGRWFGPIQELLDVPPVLPAVSAPPHFFLSLPPLCFPYQLTHLPSLPSFTLPFLQGRSLSVGFPSDGEGVDLPP